MVSAKEYIQELREIAYNSRNGWRIKTEATLEEEYDKEQFETTLRYLNDPQAYDTFKNGGFDELIHNNKDIDFDELISKLSPSLLEDIRDCTDEKYHKILENTYVSFIPYNNFSAFCTGKDNFREPLDGYIICINQGLYFCLSLLSKAFVFENLQGDLTPYYRDGTIDYQRSINLYFKPNRKDLSAIFMGFEDIPASIYGQVSAYHSAITTMMLQFIALHEFGHIVHKDVDNIALNNMYLAAIVGEEQIVVSDTVSQELWQAEYKADAFAMRALSSRSNNSSAAWANFLTIYLFFTWIADIERVKKEILCPYHPPPIKRAQKLLLVMHELYGINQEVQEMIDRINEWSQKWIQGLHDNY